PLETPPRVWTSASSVKSARPSPGLFSSNHRPSRLTSRDSSSRSFTGYSIGRANIGLTNDTYRWRHQQPAYTDRHDEGRRPDAHPPPARPELAAQPGVHAQPPPGQRTFR